MKDFPNACQSGKAMTIWSIRYADRNGRSHQLFHEQSLKPDRAQALKIVQHQLCAPDERNQQLALCVGIEILRVEEARLGSLSPVSED